MRNLTYATALLAVTLVCSQVSVRADAAEPSGENLSDAVQKVLKVGARGEGAKEASNAWQQLSQTDPAELPTLLKALDDANPLAANYLRSAIETVAARSITATGSLPKADLEKFVLDTQRNPRARRLAFELLTRVDDTAADRLIPKFLHDPSVEFRRDAVSRLLNEAEQIPADNKAALTALYQQAFSGARDLDQVEDLSKKLKELGVEVDLAEHFGFIQEWRLIGPFDNVDKQGFAVAYAPEKELDYGKSYTGKVGEVQWSEHVTPDAHGMVDLNKAIAKHMGAIAYAATEFESKEPQDVDIRVGSICAVKVWLNGELLMSHEVYHAGTQMDQYVARGKLKAGKNVILVKCAQNEQTESWAQDWQFKLRVCDRAGTAILAENRGSLKPEKSE